VEYNGTVKECNEQGISERVPEIEERSRNTFPKRIATGRQPQKSRGTQKERMRSFAFLFSRIYCSKPKEKRRKITIWLNISNF